MRVRLHFAAPGFFLNDPRLVVRLDGRTIFDGGFKDGFDVSLEVQPGDHVVETSIHLVGEYARRQRIELPLTGSAGYRDVPAVDAKLHYSRMSGNFKRRVSLSAQARP